MSDRIVRQIFPKLPSDAADQQWKFSDFANRPNIVLVGDPGAGKSHLMREAAEASKRTGQTLIVDAYAAEVLKATGYDSIPKPVEGWPNIAIFIPQAQRVALKRKGIAPIVDSYRGFRVWPDSLMLSPVGRRAWHELASLGRL